MGSWKGNFSGWSYFPLLFFLVYWEKEDREAQRRGGMGGGRGGDARLAFLSGPHSTQTSLFYVSYLMKLRLSVCFAAGGFVDDFFSLPLDCFA